MSATSQSPDLAALLSAMTLEEKLGQLSFYVARFASAGAQGANPLDAMRGEGDRLDAIRAGRVTGLFNLYGVTALRDLQRVAVEESRLKIPLLFAADVIHGFRTIFPIALAEAAAFDPALAEATARMAAEEAAAHGLHWTFAPACDLARDARWGRYEESSGEDVYLLCRLTEARVRGFQGRDLVLAPGHILATAKHFAAYGAAEAGRDYNLAEISRATLHDHYLPSFRAALAAGAATVMSAFQTVDGIPATANPYLLTTVLRGQWGFDGVVVSDFASDHELIDHGFAENRADAARLALNAGLDMNMESGLFMEQGPALLAAGAITMAQIDQAVMRVLRIKERAGLFADPYRHLHESDAIGLAARARSLSAEAARKAPVLIKNRTGLLPLPSVPLRVALTGPFARDTAHLNGPWSWFADESPGISLYDGLKDRLPAGSDLIAPEPGDDPAAQMAAMKRADVIILALGETSHHSGESRSRADITLPAGQLDLARQAHATGKPVVALIRCGRPLDLSALDPLADAILITWFLGPETGPAVADLLTGKAAPSGKLPASFPRAAGQVPLYYNHQMTGRPVPEGGDDQYKSRYIDLPPGPLYPFGFGLSYTEFAYGKPMLDSESLAWDGELRISATVTNDGARAGEEIVQLYIRDRVGSRVRPVRELKGFQRIKLRPRESVTVRFTLTRADLAFYRADDRIEAEPGLFDLWIGPHSAGGLAAHFTLEAPAA